LSKLKRGYMIGVRQFKPSWRRPSIKWASKL